MILRYLKLTNFRQFVGEQRLDFSPPGEQNVTVIYGANGAGKTTLLNAFTWALYDTLSPDFERPDELLNERVKVELGRGQAAELEVIVSFEHDDRIYDVVRSQRVECLTDGKYHTSYPRRRVTVQPIRGGGEPLSSDDGAAIIGQVLPKRLHQNFFFRGEGMERMVQGTSSTQTIDQAIRTILGLEVLDRALEHIPVAKRLLKQKLKKFDTGSDALVVKSEQLDQELSELNERRQTLTKNRDAIVVQMEQVDALLRDHAAARERQLRLDFLRNEEKGRIVELAQCRRDTRAALSADAYTAFCEALCNHSLAAVEELRAKGQVPAPYREQFVEDLLSVAECICGTKLDPGSPARQRIEALLKSAGNQELESALNRMAADAKNYLRVRVGAKGRLSEIISRMALIDRSLRSVRLEIDNIETAHRDSGNAEVADYAASREDLAQRFLDAERELMLLQARIDEKKDAADDINSKLKRAKVEDERARLLQRQLDSADRISDALMRILAIRRGKTRQQLDEQIKTTYHSIIQKDYTPELSADFHLSLTKRVGATTLPVAKSQGEAQLLALSFVGGLASLARQRFQEREHNKLDGLSTFEGGIYPVVIDSPFGTLDITYQREIARALPNLSPQVITMVSKSQGLGVVREQLAGRIGKEYVIHEQTSKKDAKSENIELNGKVHPYVSLSNDSFESSILTKVG